MVSSRDSFWAEVEDVVVVVEEEVIMMCASTRTFISYAGAAWSAAPVPL